MATEQPRRRYVDTKTRYEGVYARHSLYCDLGIGGARCNCTPTYYGTVWDKETGRNRKTRRVPLIGEARNLRSDLQAKVRQGMAHERSSRVRLSEAQSEFIAECKEGIALNKRGEPYTTKAIVNLDSSLNRLPDSIRRRYLDEIRQGELQRTVDSFGREELSSSRIRSIINAVRSLYTWALAREKATQNPAESIRLPANDSKERDRIATPAEFIRLLDQLEPQDALPWALAGYGTARSQEIRALEWPEVDLHRNVMLLAASDKARKSEAARRIVPIVRPLSERLHEEWLRQGRPTTGPVCPPRKKSMSGMLSLDQLQKRIVRAWKDAGLEPIGLHDARHTAATWLDHAHVSPKIVSVFIGHKAPKRQPDAAPITLRRYTHVLPGELERARDQLDAFLGERAREEADESVAMAA
jgi:integrase